MDRYFKITLTIILLSWQFRSSGLCCFSINRPYPIAPYFSQTTNLKCTVVPWDDQLKQYNPFTISNASSNALREF